MPASHAEMSTSTGLLAQLKRGERDAWYELTDLYFPLVYGWARRLGLQPQDASDVSQEVFRAVARSIGTFRLERPGDSFRGWLHTITRNKVRDHGRLLASQPSAAGGSEMLAALANLPDLVAPAEDSSWGSTDRNRLAQRILEQARVRFEDRTWQCFWRTAILDQAPSDVAADLGLNLMAVYKARSRVLQRLREQFADVVD